MFTTYMSGSLVRTATVFTDILGVAADPSIVTLKYRHSGTTTAVVYPSAPVVKDSTGSYHADLDSSNWLGPNNEKWFIEWVGTGTVQAVSTDYWEVSPAEL